MILKSNSFWSYSLKAGHTLLDELLYRLAIISRGENKTNPHSFITLQPTACQSSLMNFSFVRSSMLLNFRLVELAIQEISLHMVQYSIAIQLSFIFYIPAQHLVVSLVLSFLLF